MPLVLAVTVAVNGATAGGALQLSTQQVITTLADGANSVFAADLDGDGDLDVLSASSRDDKIAWYENDGAGGFGAQQVITTLADAAYSVFAADLDGDGDMDVLSASSTDDKIAWYESDGAGGFGAQQVITTLADGARSVFAADLDGDGDMDVLSASSRDDKIAWYENDGAGGFGAQQVITTLAATAYSVFAADLDGDGDMDVLSASISDNKIAWYKNDGAGGFGAQQVITTLAAAAYSVFAADLDGDGDLDVLSASYNDDKIAWYKNDGAGGFSAQQVITTLADGAYSVFAADLDGDGDMDVLSASSTDDKIAWYENDGGGGFGAQQVITTLADGAYSVFAADLDGDGDMDVLSASYNDDKIGLWFILSVSNIISSAAQSARSVFSADLDGDGDMDVLSASLGDDKIAWYENDGAGGFGAQRVITTLADGATSVFAADLDGDGDMDVLSASSNDDKIAWYENDGAGGFGAQQVITTLADNIFFVFAADLDGDGDTDVLSASANDAKIAWYENDGAGGFGAQRVITTLAIGASSVFAADLDGDGDMDVLSASRDDDKIAWYVNDGAGGFGAQQVITTLADGAYSVFAADLDGDGDMDVLSASVSDNKIAWYENDGMGGFGALRVITTLADSARSVFAADLDGDGDMDVLSASASDNKIAWYENDGTGGFGAQQVITTLADSARSVFAADLDGDGDMDVLSASYNDDKIAWYRFSWSRSSAVATVYVAGANGNDTECVLAADPGVLGLQSKAAPNCASLGPATVALAAAAGPSTVSAGGGRFALIVLSAARAATGSGPVDLAAPPGAGLLAVQINSSGTELLCPDVLLASSCVSITPGVALFGGPLTVSGGRTSGDGGCVTVRATGATDGVGGPISSGSSWPFRVPLFSTDSSPLLDAFVLRDTGVLTFSLAGLTVTSGTRPAEATLRLTNCNARGRGGGLLVAGDNTAGQNVELGRVEAVNCTAGTDGGGFAVVWSQADTTLGRPLEARNCSAGDAGGGLFLSALQFFSVDAAAGASMRLDGNAAAGCGPDLAVEGSLSAAPVELSTLRVQIVTAQSTPALSPVCVSSGASALLPECGGSVGDDVQPLTAESRQGASVILPPSCSPDAVTCAGGEAAWVNGTTICTLCVRGRAQTTSEASVVCEPCEAGRFAPEDGATACKDCAPGRSTLGVTGAVSCAVCPRGEYANATGVSTCSACEPGRFQNESEQADCVDCPRGRTSAVTRAVECSQCGVGRFTDPVTLLCTPCTPGRSSAAAEAASCQPCAFGSAAGSTGAVECTPCPRGESANDTGLAACVPCSEGRYQPEANSTACRECDPGSFINTRGSVQCVQCPPGRASAVTGSTTCSPCARQTFAGSEGLSACVPCNASEYRYADREGAQFCDLCDRDEYLSFANRSDIATFRGCLPCPAGASCASGQPLALTSAWVSPLDAATGEYRTLDCLPGRCLSARECGSSGGGAAAGDASCCAAGRRLPAADNPMCGACEAGKEEWVGKCVPCTGANGGLVLGYLALGVALLLVLQQVTAGTSGAALSKVAIGFAQAAFAFFADDGDDSPVGGGAALSFDPLGLESSCVAPMSDLTRAVLPLVQLLLVFVLFVALGALNAAWWSGCGRRANFRTSPFTRVLVALAVLGYFPVFRVAVNLLRCEELPGGARVLRQFPTVSCSSVGYHAWVGASWTLACALLVGLSLLILAYGRPRYMEYWWKGDKASDRVRKIVEKRIGFLHLSYRGDSALAASWEVAVLARSSAFVAAAALGGSSDSRFALLTLVSFAALAAHVYVQPFRRVADNRLETVALAGLVVIGSLNNSGWRGSRAARDLTALLYYGVIAGAVAMSMFLNQGRLRAAARAVHVRLKSRTSSSASSLQAGYEGEEESHPRRAGLSWRCRTRLDRAAALASRFLCWHLPRVVPVKTPPPGAAGADVADAPAANDTAAAAQEVEMNEVPAADVPPHTITDTSGQEWTVHLSADGVPYYACEATGKTQWERPE